MNKKSTRSAIGMGIVILVALAFTSSALPHITHQHQADNSLTIDTVPKKHSSPMQKGDSTWKKGNSGMHKKNGDSTMHKKGNKERRKMDSTRRTTPMEPVQ